MRKHISAAVGPLDFLEEIWVNDIVYFCWEISSFAPAQGDVVPGRRA